MEEEKKSPLTKLEDKVNAYKHLDSLNFLSDAGKAQLQGLEVAFILAKSEYDNHKEVYKWLLGYTDFPERKPGEGAYYWRKELRKKLKQIGVEI